MMNRGGSHHKKWFKNRGSGNRRSIRDDRGIVVSIGDSADSPPSSTGCFGQRRRGGFNVTASRGRSGSRGVVQVIRQALGGRKDYEQRKLVSAGRQGTITLPPWNKVCIPKGEELGREFLLKSIGAYVDSELKPINYQCLENGDVIFFVEDDEIADSIKTASRRIPTPTGQKLILYVSKQPVPFVPLPPDKIELLKVVLDKRYNHVSAHFDLNKFMHDTEFNSRQVFDMALNRTCVMYAVVKLIGENCPQVKSIDISGNRLRNLDYFANLCSLATQVTKLDLSENLIDSERELQKLSPWPIVEVSIDGNPICNCFRDQPSYISAFRKLFPKIAKLDGVELTLVYKLGFDVEEDQLVAITVQKLPNYKGSFFINDHTKTMLSSFIEQYYTLFDSGAREKLLEAYDDQATLSVTASVLDSVPFMKSDAWASYLRESHNLILKEKWEHRRTKMVRRGRLAVVSFLQELPKTVHDPSSFIIDVSFCTESLMCFNITGLFHEEDESSYEKLFNRVFIVVPQGQGMVIVNEMLFITLRSAEQNKAYVNLLQKTLTVDQQPPADLAAAALLMQQQPTTSHSLNVPQQPVVPTKQEMVIAFSKESGMKPDWAEKCLVENDWDYTKASSTFALLKAQIPSEAFT